MNMAQDLSILAMIASASIVVQLVILLLVVVSFMSWYFIFLKLFTIGRAQRRTEQFERDFWSGSDLAALYQSAVNHRHSTGSLGRFGEPLRRAARHGVGHHARVPRARQHGAGDPGGRRPGDRRGPGRDRDRPLCRDN